MTAPEVVIARLKTIAGVTALVATRIYQVKLPQKPTLPAIRVQRVSDEETVHLRGTSQALRCRVQVDSVSSELVISDPLSQVNAVDAAVHGTYLNGIATGLCGWSGYVGGSPAVRVWSILPADVREGYDADDLRQFKMMRDYFVTFTRI